MKYRELEQELIHDLQKYFTDYSNFSNQGLNPAAIFGRYNELVDLLFDNFRHKVMWSYYNDITDEDIIRFDNNDIEYLDILGVRIDIDIDDAGQQHVLVYRDKSGQKYEVSCGTYNFNFMDSAMEMADSYIKTHEFKVDPQAARKLWLESDPADFTVLVGDWINE